MLNITLFIQALNFLIAYAILAKFFFKPVLSFMQESAYQEQKVHDLIIKYKAILKDGNNKKQCIWNTAYATFNQHTMFCSLIGRKLKANDQGLTSKALESNINIKSNNELAKILADSIITME